MAEALMDRRELTEAEWVAVLPDPEFTDPPPEGDEFADHAYCPHCFTIDPGEDYCGSCGERL